MLDVTPQERMALVVLAVLMTAGGFARHAANRADARRWLEYTAEQADTLSPNRGSALRDRAEEELARQRIRNTPLKAGERIDPNTAPSDELARLPRIGPALADRIVADREANGPFRSTGDLRRVPGIGPALLQGIEPSLDLPAGPAGQGASGAAPPIDLNRASADELQRIPGIGPAIAARVVEHRAANGPFRDFAELERVPGIGPRLRERIQGVARLGP